MREGVTNVIKPSGATRCRVTLGPTHLEIQDDGHGAPSGTTSGNGLRDLADRLRPVHATLTAHLAPTGGKIQSTKESIYVNFLGGPHGAAARSSR